MKTALSVVAKRFCVSIVAGAVWSAVSAAPLIDDTTPVVPVPDFTCKSAYDEFWPVVVTYTSANNLIYVQVKQPVSTISYRLPPSGYMNVNTANVTTTGFVLTASRTQGDQSIIQAAAIPSAHGPYTVTAHLDMKKNAYQRFIKDVDISDCIGYPQL